MARTALLIGLTAAATLAFAANALDALLEKDPVVEAEKAYAKGDRRHIVVPVCGKDGGDLLPGWPPEDSPRARSAMDKAKRPLSCSDLGKDPERRNLLRAAEYAGKYNRKLLELEDKNKR